MPSDPATDRAPTVVLVPLRSPGVGKTRLATALTVEQRATLAAAMLADVVAALRAAPLDRIVVAADGPAAVAAATLLGTEAVTDPPAVAAAGRGRRLDVALAAAADRLGAVGTLLVVAADLPRLRGDEVAALLDADAEVAVAPTRDGGTGGLLRRPADACATAYGPGSAARHLALAQRAGRRAARIELAGFAHDIDRDVDLDDWRRTDLPPLGAHTAAALGSFGRDATRVG